LKVLLVTGERGVGKSTCVRRLRQALTASNITRFKGYETDFAVAQEDARHLICKPIGFEAAPFCVANQSIHPYRRIQPYPEAFRRMADLLESIDPETECAYIDEIGFLETLDDRLQQSILTALSRSVFSIAVIRLGDYPFLRKVKALYQGAVVELTAENRDRVYAETLFNIRTGPIHFSHKGHEKGVLKI